MNHEAIYKLNPSVVTIRGDVAYDKDDVEVAYNKDAVQDYVNAHDYIAKRASEYPQAYIDACLAVKAKYP